MFTSNSALHKVHTVVNSIKKGFIADGQNTALASSHYFSTTPRILLVEDTPIIQKVNLHFLAQLGCEAELAGNGQEAITKLKQDYSLILLDIDLPDISGLQVAKTSGGR